MPHPNERVEPEMKIMRRRRIARQTSEQDCLKRINEQIADIERRLRTIDEQRRLLARARS